MSKRTRARRPSYVDVMEALRETLKILDRQIPHLRYGWRKGRDLVEQEDEWIKARQEWHARQLERVGGES